MNDESGWLIERRDLPQPVWWCGASSRGMEWSPNSLEAIRFSRKIDADMVNVSMLGSCGDATEHKWIATPELAAVPPSPDLCACGHGRAMHFDEDGDHNGPCLWQVHKDAPFCKCDMWHRKPSEDEFLGVPMSEWRQIAAEINCRRGPNGSLLKRFRELLEVSDMRAELFKKRNAPSPSTEAVEPCPFENLVIRASVSGPDMDGLVWINLSALNGLACSFGARAATITGRALLAWGAERSELLCADDEHAHRRPAPSQEKLRTWKDVGADRLADEVAVLIARHVIDSRSPAADALLDYREGNQMRSPRSDRLAELEAEVERLKASPSMRDGVIEEAASMCDAEVAECMNRVRNARGIESASWGARADVIRGIATRLRKLKSHPAARAGEA